MIGQVVKTENNSEDKYYSYLKKYQQFANDYLHKQQSDFLPKTNNHKPQNITTNETIINKLQNNIVNTSTNNIHFQTPQKLISTNHIKAELRQQLSEVQPITKYENQKFYNFNPSSNNPNDFLVYQTSKSANQLANNLLKNQLANLNLHTVQSNHRINVKTPKSSSRNIPAPTLSTYINNNIFSTNSTTNNNNNINNNNNNNTLNPNNTNINSNNPSSVTVNSNSNSGNNYANNNTNLTSSNRILSNFSGSNAIPNNSNVLSNNSNLISNNSNVISNNSNVVSNNSNVIGNNSSVMGNNSNLSNQSVNNHIQQANSSYLSPQFPHKQDRSSMKTEKSPIQKMIQQMQKGSKSSTIKKSVSSEELKITVLPKIQLKSPVMPNLDGIQSKILSHQALNRQKQLTERVLKTQDSEDENDNDEDIYQCHQKKLDGTLSNNFPKQIENDNISKSMKIGSYARRPNSKKLSYSQVYNMFNLKNSQGDASSSLNKIKLNLRYSFRSVAGQENSFVQKKNQDQLFIVTNFIQDPYSWCLGVCDGHGENGHKVAKYIRKQLPKNIGKCIKEDEQQKNYFAKKSYSSLMQTAYQLTTQSLLQSLVECEFSGTTNVTVVIRNNQLICANVGDSRAILIKESKDNEWSVIPLSHDHKPDSPNEKARILEAGGRVEKMKSGKDEEYGPYRVWKQEESEPGLAMSRSFGDTQGRDIGIISEPEVTQLIIDQQCKAIVVASDGIWEFLSNVDICMMIQQFYHKNDVNGAVNFIVEQAIKTWDDHFSKSFRDDITCIVVFVNNNLKEFKAEKQPVFDLQDG